MDNDGRYFYIKDGDTIWSPGWKPCRTPLDSYECRHGMGYTRITGVKNGVEASALFFVPLKTWAEVQKLTLRNTTSEIKSLKLFTLPGAPSSALGRYSKADTVTSLIFRPAILFIGALSASMAFLFQKSHLFLLFPFPSSVSCQHV